MGWKIVGLIISALFIALSVSLSAIAWSGHNLGIDAATTPPIVDTPSGRYVGVVSMSNLDGSNYVSYRSIPFAKPPVGALRFKRPQPLDNVATSRLVNSDTYKKSCWSATKLSTDSNYDEDCLYLSVYVPGSGGHGIGTNPLPVMVWIHGGGFVAGSTFPEPGRLVTRGNVIVVSVNYRLGVFGFLTMEDDDLPSNNGLWDQYMALKWVKDNIRFFNGDDSSITVFGESAGGSSTAFHVLSPVSTHLFHKAVLQSGPATFFLSRDAKQRTMAFADMVGCFDHSVRQSAIAQCLRSTTVGDILQHQKPSSFSIPTAQRQLDFIWMPVVDGVFIPEEPLALLNNRTYLTQIGAFGKDYLIGVVNNEGALTATNFLNPIPLSDLSTTTFLQDLIDYLLYGRYGSKLNKTQELEDAIYTFYTGASSRSPSLHPQTVLDLASDVAFVVPAIEMAMSLSSCEPDDALSSSCLLPSATANNSNCPDLSSKVYFYHFDYCPQSDSCSPQCMVHGADVALEFPTKNFPDAIQQQLSDTFVDLLTTFARTSNPGTSVTSGWPTFDHTTRSYLRIDPYPSIRHGYVYDYRVNFWLNAASNLVRFSS